MSRSPLCFGHFRLDPADRRLSRDGAPVELNARYLDALILLVEAGGELVTKERFMAEVWRGIPVTDEALTQAIRTLRRTLDDSAVAPRFIQTVPKHGYRFIAAIEQEDGLEPARSPIFEAPRARFLRQTLAATGGALLAGALVGLAYGLIAATQPQSAGGGAISLLLVLVLVSICSAGVAGAGIGVGLAASQSVQPPRWYWRVAGGALGGVTLGAFANLLGSDAFRLLFGQDVGDFAGATEGFILGGAVGLAAFLADHRPIRALSIAAVLGAAGGLAIALLDGRMMAGSLESLAAAFPASQLGLEAISGASGENGLGPIGLALTSALEGAIFATGLVWGLTLQNVRPVTASPPA